MDIQTLIARKRRNYGHRLMNMRHQLIDYPLETIPTDRPRLVEGRPSASEIPRVIVQTYRTPTVASPVYSAVIQWQEMNPEFDYRFFDDDECRAFIETHFPPEVVQAFDCLVPGAYKADLWRYCYLAEKGGVYVDIRMEPLLALRTVLGFGDAEPPSFVGVRDLLQPDKDMRSYLYNAFMAAAPRHPIVLAALDRTLANIKARDYGRDTLDITGPGCLGAALNVVLGSPFDGPIALGDHSTPQTGRYRILDHRYDPFHREVVALDQRPAIVTKCIHGDMANADKTYSKWSYASFYRRGLVFK